MRLWSMLNLKKKIIMKKFNFSKAEKIVIKLGSSIVTNNEEGLDERCLSSLIKQISILSAKHKKVILVSSGAIAAGLRKLGTKKRPKVLSELQAAAAIGQMDLVRTYEELFSDNGLIAAQVLLTHDDLSDRKRYLNARSTIFNLIKNNVIPVINENDTVASEEIRFGDNDSLAAMVANLIEADILVLLTDQDGLFSSDPRQDSNARLIRHSYVDDKSLEYWVELINLLSNKEIKNFFPINACLANFENGTIPKTINFLIKLFANKIGFFFFF